MRKNIEIVYEEEKEKLKLILYKQLQNLLFKRTVKTCTPYGFM
jgi:hypothetical protein